MFIQPNWGTSSNTLGFSGKKKRRNNGNTGSVTTIAPSFTAAHGHTHRQKTSAPSANVVDLHTQVIASERAQKEVDSNSAVIPTIPGAVLRSAPVNKFEQLNRILIQTERKLEEAYDVDRKQHIDYMEGQTSTLPHFQHPDLKADEPGLMRRYMWKDTLGHAPDYFYNQKLAQQLIAKGLLTAGSEGIFKLDLVRGFHADWNVRGAASRSENSLRLPVSGRNGGFGPTHMLFRHGKPGTTPEQEEQDIYNGLPTGAGMTLAQYPDQPGDAPSRFIDLQNKRFMSGGEIAKLIGQTLVKGKLDDYKKADANCPFDTISIVHRFDEPVGYSYQSSYDHQTRQRTVEPKTRLDNRVCYEVRVLLAIDPKNPSQFRLMTAHPQAR